MIQAKLLNSAASLNDFKYIEAIDYVPGENLTVAFQIFDAQKGIRYVPPVAATMTAVIVNSDDTELTKVPTVINADDRSMWKFTLSQAETEALGGQNIEITLDVNGDGTVIQKAIIQNGLIRINLAGDC